MKKGGWPWKRLIGMTFKKKAGIVSNKLCLLELALSHPGLEKDDNGWIVATIANYLDDLEQDVTAVYSGITHNIEKQKDGRKSRLERFMESLADQMEEEPEDWNFKAEAANIRELLVR